MKRVKLTFDRTLLKEAVRAPRIRQAAAVHAAKRGDLKPIRLWFARAVYSTCLEKMKARWLNPFVWRRRAKDSRTDWKEAFEMTLLELRTTPLELELQHG